MIKNILRQHISLFTQENGIKQWFDPLDLSLDKEKKCLTVTFPHSFFSCWFLRERKNEFEEYVKEVLPNLSVVYTGYSTDNRCLEDNLTSKEYYPFQQNNSHVKIISDKFYLKNNGLKNFTFENFIYNKKNDFPIITAHEVLNHPFSSLYFPCIFYGQSGSGKTHILYAMVTRLHNKIPFIFCGTVKEFEKALTLQNSSCVMKAFFIDDIQQLINKPAQQEQLVDFFDKLDPLKNLLVFSMDTHPSKCTWMVNKLRMRLSQGLVIELKKPDLDVRHRYVRKKNKLLQLNLNKEIILSIARSFHDFRLIDGVLNKIKTYHSVSSINQNNIMELIGKEGGIPTSLSHRLIIEKVAKYHNVDHEDILGKNRGKDITTARQVAMYLCRELLGIPLVQIGSIFNGRDHSSVLYAINKIKQLKVTNKDMNIYLSKLKDMCLFPKS